MLKLEEFRSYITSIKEAISEITDSETVMDDSQLSKFLQKQKADTYLILGIIAKHKLEGSSDNLRSKDMTTILILEKVNRKKDNHEAFLDRIQKTQVVTEKVIKKLISDFEDEERCDFIRYLIPSSLDINPIWGMNSCDGYEIDFSLQTIF